MVSSAVKQYESGVNYYRSHYQMLADISFPIQEIVEDAFNKLLATKPFDRPFNLIVRWHEPGSPLKNAYAAGLGDMSHACKIIKLVQQHFPEVRIFLTSLSYDDEDEVLEKIDLLPLKVFNIKNQHELFLGVQCPKALPKYLRTHYFEVPTIMLDVATPTQDVYPFWDDELGKHENGLNLLGCFHIDEYNGHRTKSLDFDGDATHNWFSAGLGYSQARLPCKGIHIDSSLSGMHLPYSALSNLKDQQLAHWFKIKKDLPPVFYFGYFSTYDEKYQSRFVQSILNYESKLQTDSDIDIFLLSPGQILTPFVKTDFWKSIHFKSVQIICNEWSKMTKTPLLDPNAHRKIRVIFWSKKLPREDVLQLMQATGKALLVTGDQSLAEAISLKDRVIFYEMQSWKTKLVKNIGNLAKYRYGKGNKINQFIELQHQDNGDQTEFQISLKLGAFLSDTMFLRQHRDFMEYLAENHNINTWLIGKLNRSLITHYSPELFSGEAKIVEDTFIGQPARAKRTIREIATRVSKHMKAPGDQRAKRQRAVLADVAAAVTEASIPATTGETYQYRLDLISKVQCMFLQ